MNKFTNYVWMAAGFAAVAAVVSGIMAGPAVAQLVKAALVKNVNEPGREPFEISIEFTNSGCVAHCVNFSSTAGLQFDSDPSVPAGKRWVVTQISGYVPSLSATDIFVELQGGASLNLDDFLKFIYWGPFFDQGVYQGFSSPVFTTIGPGERAHLHLGINGASGNESAIALGGYLIDSTN